MEWSHVYGICGKTNPLYLSYSLWSSSSWMDLENITSYNENVLLLRPEYTKCKNYVTTRGVAFGNST